MTRDSSLPIAASLWVGESLGWLEHGCLASFATHGQHVILYSYQPVDNVPGNVETRDARDIWTPSDEVWNNTAPSYIADLFRLHLILKTDFIWVDTDIILLQPLVPDNDGFLIGYTPWHKEVNNCILRLPANSQTMTTLTTYMNDLSLIPEWMRPALRQRLAKTRVEDREVIRFQTLRTVMGPHALTHALEISGEIKQAAEPDVLSPVPWQYLDVLFNPFGGWEGWFTEDTRAVHLWSNALRQHRKRPVHPDSFVGKAFSDLNVPVP